MATIKSINLKNFKCLRNISIDLKPLTIIVGKNSSGKTSLLQSLLLIKQTIASEDPLAHIITSGTQVNLGSYKDLVFKHDVRSKIGLEFNFASDPTRYYREELTHLAKKEFYISLTYSFPSEKSGIILNEMKFLNSKKEPMTCPPTLLHM